MGYMVYYNPIKNENFQGPHISSETAYAGDKPLDSRENFPSL